jgi:hypothetical protein
MDLGMPKKKLEELGAIIHCTVTCKGKNRVRDFSFNAIIEIFSSEFQIIYSF